MPDSNLEETERKSPGAVLPSQSSSESDGCRASQNSIGLRNRTEALETLLKHEAGEKNFFLNVMIQALWHLKQFREKLLGSRHKHTHLEDPCTVCVLCDIFENSSLPSGADGPTRLRVALSKIYPDKIRFFQEGHMGDASEVLALIFDCLHESFTSDSSNSSVESGIGSDSSDSSVERSVGSWSCASKDCVAHSLFGMNIFEQSKCNKCGIKSKKLKHTSFFHHIRPSALLTEKVINSKVDNLFGVAAKKHQIEHCGVSSYIDRFIPTPPHVFTAVISWPNTRKSGISATLTSLTTELDVSVVYKGLDQGNKHRLRSLVCYCKQHYHCIGYSCEQEKWTLYTDKTVEVIGEWDEVITLCEEHCLQPQVLFFEAKEDLSASTKSSASSVAHTGTKIDDHSQSKIAQAVQETGILNGQNEGYVKEYADTLEQGALHLDGPYVEDNTTKSPREQEDDHPYMILGKELQNQGDEYNCFLNVIIQSLWHLKPFREELSRMELHKHHGRPCVVCALSKIFGDFSRPSTSTQTEAVTCLRVALAGLSNLYPGKRCFHFQKGQMNDASEALAVIVDCLHESSTSGSSDPEINCTCIAHSHFGMNISEEFKCYACPFKSVNKKPSFAYKINARALRTFKSLRGDIPFWHLLKLAELNHQSACVCRKPNYTYNYLSTPPHVFTAVLGWESTWESAGHLSATLKSLATELDVAYLYRGINLGCVYRLVSMVCYSARNYCCFTYRCDQEQWTMYDGISVEVIGKWDDVICMCERRHSQPHVLFFEAIN